MTLYTEYLTHQGRTIDKWTHYFPVYETHFARYINRPVTFLEIACGAGGSLQLWKRYLGPLEQIVGIDVNENCTAFEEEQIRVRIGDKKDSKFLNGVVEEFALPHVFLEDGSHIMGNIT